MKELFFFLIQVDLTPGRKTRLESAFFLQTVIVMDFCEV